ncbi:MAG: hypothetical protein HYT96_00430 [Armatimonadetes bacterium]|nr:hypothetical protein [Armatimonadota bacterium]MBI2201334.1 hypothetical protein [Armatimonadota bacterium]MBI2972857.1 hypothetical protein [Armatimonadota bacterium]
MKLRGIIVLVLTVLVLAVAIAPAFAQQYPNVSNLRPFSPEANFMSLPGYLRWLVFQQTAQWITYAEAARIVRQQLEAGR